MPYNLHDVSIKKLELNNFSLDIEEYTIAFGCDGEVWFGKNGKRIGTTRVQELCKILEKALAQ